MRKLLTCLMVLVLLAPNALRADEKKNAANNSKDSYLPVYQVKATAMDDNTVKACWSWEEIIPDKLLVNFESGDLSDTDFDNTVSNYPWVITENAYEGTYAIKSSNEGKPNSTSAIEITVDVPYNGVMGFNCRVSSETEYDFGRFYIDDVMMLEMSGFKMWQYREYEITEGTHTYRWEYKKDNGTDKEEDAFFLDNVKLFGEVEPFAGGWVTYSDTAYVESVSPGYNAQMWWGIKFPRTESYKDMVLSAISVFDAQPGAGNYTANIFVGGDDAPATLASTQTFSLTGKEEFVDVELSNPVEIEGDQPLWITLHTTDIFAPAAGCEYADDINSDWLSLDGTNWGHIKSDYDFHYSWMIKGYIENQEGKRIELAKEEKNRAEFNSYKVYRYDCFAGEISDETVTLLAENVTDTLFLDNQWANMEDGIYQWGVSAVYDGNNESTITWSNIVDKNMIAEVNVNVTTNNDKTAEGTLVRFINKSEPGMEYDYEVVLDETGVHTWKKFRKGIYEVTISNDGYYSCYESEIMEIWDNTTLNCELEEIVAAVNLYVSPTGWAMWDEDQNSSNALSYDIYLNNTFLEQITTTYYQHTDLVVGQSYTTKVIANYATGTSDPMTYTWTFKDCENYEGVSDFTLKYANGRAVLNWVVPGIDASLEPQTLTYGFENDDLDEWTTIDGNNDGHVWYHSVEANSHDVDPVDAHTGNGYICSESFCNSLGALEPDDYLVSPEKIVATATSRITFWVSAQDAGYAGEHFGVAISTDGNTSAYDFTTVSEWTLVAKSASHKAERNSKDQGRWFQYEVDLSSYEGQEIWVAIRHFDVSDMFILLVDDIELVDVAIPSESKDESLALGAIVYRDGELLTPTPIRTGRYSEPMAVQTEREYCVKVVYGGENDVTYYAMSCPECETLFSQMQCDAPEDLYGVQSLNDNNKLGVRLVWPYEAPTSNWLYYDDGLKLDGIGGPQMFSWGVMFPASSLIGYAGTTLTKVSMYDNAMSSGYINIYSGGTTEPGEMVHSQQYTSTGTEDFVEFQITLPFEVDVTKNLWIVFTTYNGDLYPAAAAYNCGDPNSRWISMDGITWEDISDYGLNYSWMIRAYLSGDLKENSGRSLNHYNIYRGESAEEFELIAQCYEPTYFDVVGEGEYYYQVTAVYMEEGHECESDPANAYENEEQNYIVVEVSTVSVSENDIEGLMVYPNPAKDVLNISAEAMTRVSIINTLGQTIYDQAVDSDQTVIDMSAYETGVYMLRITTENGVATRRIMVNN